MLRYVLVGVASALALLGCSSGSPPPVSVYDACFNVTDCVEAATLCEALSLDFGGYTYSNAICTLECLSEGPISPDCPRAWVGRLGSCYPSRIGGGIDETPVCFEPCDFDEDCQWSFRCLDAVDLCGPYSGACPIDEGDSICVPGPN